LSRLREIVASTTKPLTRAALARDLAALGVTPGMTLAVHSSLSALGYVAGGAAAVIRALEDCVGYGGTLAMPTHSFDLSDPAHWDDPPVPAAWHPIIR
jgi:aminoglycoside 3-N-acetyltransferase